MSKTKSKNRKQINQDEVPMTEYETLDNEMSMETPTVYGDVEVSIEVPVEVEPEADKKKGKVASKPFVPNEEQKIKLAGFNTTSAKIRYLTTQKDQHDTTLTRTQIAKYLGILYQHVRNIQVQELKKGPRE